MRDKDRWAEKIRSQMDGYSEPVPAELWTQIEKELSSRRIIPLWQKVSAAAAVALLLAFSSLTVWFWSSVDTSQMPQLADVTVPLAEWNPAIVTAQDSAALPAVAMMDNETASDPASAMPAAQRQSYQRNVPMNKEYAIFAASLADSYEEDEVEETSTADVEEDRQVECYEADAAEETVQPFSRRDNRERDRVIMRYNKQMMAHTGNGRNGRWNIALSAANVPYTSSSTNSGIDGLSRHVAHRYMSADFTSLHTLVNPATWNAMETSIRHRLPVETGITFSYYFTKSWAVETGLTYTLLSSEWNSSDQFNASVHQKLHYLGIPLKLHRQLWQNNLLQLYASAGGALEKCVKTRITAHNKSNGRTSVESPHLNELQCSLAVGMGAHLKLTRFMGVYVEPGVVYYFNDGSEFETIRKKHPFNFNLRVGLRFSSNR